MPDFQQYPLPNPGLPLGQQAVSPVATTNPLMSAASGIGTGVQLGLQAQQVQMQRQAQQTALLQAQAAIKAQQQKNMIDYSTQLDSNLKNIADIDHGMAIRFYKEKVLPFHNAIGEQYGLPPMDPNAINSEDNTPQELERISTLYHTMISDPQKAALAQGELNDIFTKEIYNKKISEAAGSAMKSGEEYNKHQSDMLQNAKTEFDKQLSNRGGGLGLQDAKVNQAAHLRTMINQNSTIDPKTGQVTYHFPKNVQGELVVGLANLVSGSNMSSVEQLDSLTPKTFKGDLASRASYWANQPFDSTPQKFAQQLVEQIDRQGSTAQQQRDTYQNQFHASIDPALSPKYQELLHQTTRGIRFEDYQNSPMKQQGDRIRVVNKSTGQKGTILKSDFDPKKYMQ